MLCLCVQTLVISSSRVRWQKQGTCRLVDDQPPPPTITQYESALGWKEVTGCQPSQGGGGLPLPGTPDPPGYQERVPAHQGRQGSRVFQAEQSEELHGVVPPLVPGEDLAEQGGCVPPVAVV